MRLLILAFSTLALAGAANASPCSERVAALQARFDAAHPSTPAVSPDIAGAAAETTGAKLHHQPTEASVPGADAKANSSAEDRAAHFSIEIEQAKAAADSGDEPGCEAAARDAERSLGP